jgi:hypothetical protein
MNGSFPKKEASARDVGCQLEILFTIPIVTGTKGSHCLSNFTADFAYFVFIIECRIPKNRQ